MAPNRRIAFLPGAAGERALVARLVAGDELAYRECYELHAAKIFRVLVRTLGNPAKAEDVLQETFAAAFAKIGQFRGEAQLGTWITGIAIRRALNLVRAEGRRLPPATTSDEIEPADESAGEEARLASRDLARHLLQLMDRLDPPRRLALLLHAEGYTAAEIAEMTDAPRGTVLSHISRARAELIGLLDHETPAESATQSQAQGQGQGQGQGKSRG